MAKRTIIERTTKRESIREKLFDMIGENLANQLTQEVLHLKSKGQPECLLVTDNDTDITITITQKKNCIEYEDEAVIRNYTNEIYENNPIDIEMDEDEEIQE